MSTNTWQEHYKLAEQLLERAMTDTYLNVQQQANIIAMAQAHATLASLRTSL
jgi:hypothetical protein